MRFIIFMLQYNYRVTKYYSMQDQELTLCALDSAKVCNIVVNNLLCYHALKIVRVSTLSC